MIRYVSQLHEYSCGPTTILNVLKWLGIDATIENDYWRLIEECKCNPYKFQDWSDRPRGTWPIMFEKVLRNELRKHATVETVYLSKLSDIRRMLGPDSCAVLEQGWIDVGIRHAHYFLCTAYKNHLYSCVNAVDHKGYLLPTFSFKHSNQLRHDIIKNGSFLSYRIKRK